MRKILFFVIFLYSQALYSYALPNDDEINKSIINTFYKQGEWVEIKDNRYIPFLDFSKIQLKEFKNITSFDFEINVDNDTQFYKEFYSFPTPKENNLMFFNLSLNWGRDGFDVECTQPYLKDNDCGYYAKLFGDDSENHVVKSDYFYKGNFYSIKFRDTVNNIYCRSSRKFVYDDNNKFIKLNTDLTLCARNSSSKYYNEINFSFNFLNNLGYNNSYTLNDINNKNFNLEEIKKKEREKKKKAEEKRKEEERQKKLKEAEEQRKEEERQEKLKQKKKELEEKRKQEEEKRRIEEELKREAEEKKRKLEEERKKREAEEKRKEELQKNIQDSKSALSVAKKNQNKLITETKNLELQFREIKSANTIQKIDDIMKITNKIYDTTQTYIKSFDVNYERVERLFKKNPKTELNLIFNEFTLLNTQINNQKNVISEIYMEIFDIHTNKKNKFEKELRDKELTDAFMRSDQAYIYTYVPIAVAILLLLILLWRWNSSGRQIAYLNNKIRDLEKNNEKSNSPTTQVPKPIEKTEKQETTITTSINTPEKDKIKKDQIKNIEEPISNEIEKLNNLIDDKTFMDKYLNALSDLNSLKSFTDEFKVKGLERFSSQRVEEGIELELSQRIVDKAMFWLIENPQTFELLILPGRDLWSRSRLLLQDTSRFGYLNFNGIFDLSEGEEFKLTNFAIVSLTDKKKYKIEQKGELILPKSN